MEQRIHLLGLDRDELQAELAKLGMPAFRAGQVRQWIFDKRAGGWAAMTNLSKLDRTRLADALVIASAKVASHQQAKDGVHKLLLAWPDETTSEAVMIPAEDERHTACISTQVGCPVGCRFCASGIEGLQRNLTAGEIVEQVWQLAREAVPPNDRISNVVLMGIGEPLANYDAVVRAIRLINADDGLNVGARKITLSTIGLPAQIRKLAREGLQITLAISLHAPNQRLRAELIPWAAKFPLTEVLDAARFYFEQTGREITLEYILLQNVNTEQEHADQLADLAHSLRCNVNLIYYNPVEELSAGLERATQATAGAFREHLIHRGVNVHIRASRGLTIDAACGQLRRRHAGKNSGQ